MALLDLDDLPEPEVVYQGELVDKPVPVDATQRQLAKAEELAFIQERIFEKTCKSMEDVLSYADIDPTLEAPPEEWIEELGQARAWERFRTVRYNLMGAKEAPVATKLVAQTYIGIVRAKSLEKGGPVRLNVEKVFFNIGGPAPSFPRLELEADK